MASLTKELYEPLVTPYRRILTDDPIMIALVDPGIDSAVLERFLIEFCALGVQITRPVDGWIRRAGERCREIGLEDIGRMLVTHAAHEAGHHLMLEADTRLLVGRWNERHPKSLSAEALMARAAAPPMQAYSALHEETIAGDMPYGQVAIELEIEGMSTTFGPKQIGVCKRILGPDIMKGLSFIEEHVAIDVGHTAFNTRLMDRVLEVRPESARRLAELGGRALRYYVDFFGECLHTAQHEVGAS
jgi:hypothetical protein